MEQQEEMEVVDHWMKPEQDVQVTCFCFSLFSEERMEECVWEYELVCFPA